MAKEREERWNLKTACECVIRNGGKASNKQVSHPQPGIKVLGAMDYLKNYCKFTSSIEPVRAKRKEVVEERAPVIVVIKKRKTKLKEDD